MAVRRTLYLIILAASFLLYLFHTAYLSWLLLILVGAVPVISILMTLPLMARSHVKLHWDRKTGETNQKSVLTIHTGLPYPITDMKVKLEISNLYYKEDIERIVRLKPGQQTIPALVCYGNKCGVYRASVKWARIQDYLGLISLPVKYEEPVQMMVIPAAIPFSGENLHIKVRESTELYDLRQSKLRGAGDREHSDVRGFREGDALRDVHWKLSARQGQLMVREYEPDGFQAMGIWLVPAGDPDKFAGSIQRLLGLTDYLDSQRQPYRLISQDQPGGTAGLKMQLIGELLSSPPRKAASEQEEVMAENQKSRLFVVMPENITLYIDGKEQGVFT